MWSEWELTLEIPTGIEIVTDKKTGFQKKMIQLKEVPMPLKDFKEGLEVQKYKHKVIMDKLNWEYDQRNNWQVELVDYFYNEYGVDQ